MLEGVVARLLNQWLGKYVLDLDTENLNIGIFSGQVQLTELRLKPEALYELNLPIQITFGTIGKISIQIPWNALLNQSVVIQIEDVHILAEPIIATSFDSEKEKRLIRAAKRKILSDLYIDGDIIGGPALFSEHLITSIINHFQVTVQNIHIRYEDKISIPGKSVAAGLCISSITAETTNNKWKASNTPKGCSIGYHLLKIESFSVYWNHCCELQTWDWKTQYYLWRNAMTHSLQTFSMNNQDFDFLIKPMTCKIKFIINKSSGSQAMKLLVDVVLQDFTAQISREQYKSFRAVLAALHRIRTSRQFLHLRPTVQRISKQSAAAWWHYAFGAVLEHRVRPYTWVHIAKTRASYRLYRDAYKRLLQNPHDTELKLDLQKYEDSLSLINIVIAREHARTMLELEVPDCGNSPLERGRSFWSMLPSPERNHLCQMIGYEENNEDTSSSCRYVEHKYNVTVSNVSVSLLCEGREVLVATMTQLLAAAETHAPAGTLRQLSARAEGLVVEGASIQDHLVPLISAQHHCNGNNGTALTANVFSMDFQTMPSNATTATEASYKLWCCLEAVEVTFHAHAIVELFKFFDDDKIEISFSLTEYFNSMIKKIKKMFYEVLKCRVDLNLEIKIPYFVIPEYGSFTQTGNLLVVDFGRLMVRTELAQMQDEPEDTTLTQMEAEERAYSRVLLEFTHAQLLFCDSSENWRDARREIDTELHVVARLDAQVVLAACAYTEQRLPRLKLNASVPSVKLNLVERKLILFLTYLENLEKVIEPLMEKSPLLSTKNLDEIIWNKKDNLAAVKQRVRAKGTERRPAESRRVSHVVTEIEQDTTVSDCSEESSGEAWAHRVDLPGLEDNVSPHNTVKYIVRLIIGEICVVLSRSSERIDRAYLMLRVAHAVLDAAALDYGPALQLAVRSVSLTDKLHTGAAGQYLDLLHAPQDCLLLLYRHVRADCPDFRSHFHSVEHSFVADFGPLNFLVHRDAIRALVKYSQYLNNKIEKHSSYSWCWLCTYIANIFQRLTRGCIGAPPVPPGAVKFSQSVRATQLTARLGGADRDLLELRASGFELDILSRANERRVLRVYLASLHADHLTDVTLYPRVLTSEDDNLLELKYVRHATAAGTVQGSVRLHVGRVHVTLLYTLLRQLHHFVRPLLNSNIVKNWVRKIHEQAVRVLHPASAPRLHIAVNIHGPTLLLPQKTASPNLLVVHTGELNIENFFKETILENILLRLEGVTVLRAVMTLAATLETQEAMLEPLNMRLDIKRCLNPGGYLRPPAWELHGAFDLVRITLAQRDLATLLAVYADNINEAQFVDISPDSPVSPPADQDNQDVKCLEAFFCQTESKNKNISIKLDAEGLLLSLFCDCEEVLSSPVRDLNHGLCRLEIGDTLFSADLFTDNSLEAKLSMQNITVVDIRPDSNSANNSILRSQVDVAAANTYQISVSSPPVLDVSFHETAAGDRFVDGVIERVQLVIHAPLLAALVRFVLDALPVERRIDGGCINHGYVADLEDSPVVSPHLLGFAMAPGLTIALRMCKPELVFLADSLVDHSAAFSARTELLIDYSRHAMRENLIISLSNFQILFNAARNSSAYYTLLHPCDVEFSKCFKIEDGIKSMLTLSNVQIHANPGVFITLTDILEDIQCHLNPSPTEHKIKQFLPYMNQIQDKIDDLEDLWSPKKLSGCYVPELPVINGEIEINVKELDVNQVFIASIASVTVVLELEVPVVLVQASFEATVHDWSKQLHGTIELHIQANYFNEQVDSWEPLIEPVVLDEGSYRPWEVCVRVHQAAAVSISETTETSTVSTRAVTRRSAACNSSGEESSSDGGMTFLRPTHASTGDVRSQHARLAPSLASFLDEASDSDVEDGSMERLAAAICDLFTGDWNESDESECAPSTASDVSEESDSSERRPITTNNSPEQLAIYVLVHAQDSLQVTLTSQTVRLLHELLHVYTGRAPSIITTTNTGAVTLHNDVGPGVRIDLLRRPDNVVLCSKTFEQQDSIPSSPVSESSDGEGREQGEVIADLDYQHHGTDDLLRETLLFLDPKSQITWSEQLAVHVPGHAPLYTACPRRAWRRLLRLQSSADNTSHSQVYHVAVQHEMTRKGRMLHVASPLQLRNETAHALAVLCERESLTTLGLPPLGDVHNPFDGLTRVTMLGPHDEYNVPLLLAYHCRLYVQPVDLDSAVHASDSALWWPELITELGTPRDLVCKPKQVDTDEVFALRVLMQERQLNGNAINQQIKRSVPNYTMRLLAPLVVRNLLPCGVTLNCIKHIVRVDAGECATLHTVLITRTVRLQLQVQYMGLTWRATLALAPDMDDKLLNMATEHDTDGGNKQLALCVHVDRSNSCEVSLYVPYWLLNKTGLPLQLRTSAARTVHDVPSDVPLLLAVRRGAQLYVRLRAFQSAWSAEFRLDAAGTAGLVVARDRERGRRYPVLLRVVSARICPRFTRIVTLAPNHLVRNLTTRPLRFMEENERADLWLDLAPGATVALWPETNAVQLRVKHRDSSGAVVSQRVSAIHTHRTVLRMERGGAVCVDVRGGGTRPLCVTFQPYSTGVAPVRIDNLCTDLHLKLQQRGQGQVALLAPRHSLLYTWDDPCADRALVWNVYNNKGTGLPLDINNDDCGEVRLRLHTIRTASTDAGASSSSDSDSSSEQQLNKTPMRRDKVTVYWVCYMDRQQRTVLFTQEARVAQKLAAQVLHPRCDLEVCVALAGITLSLCANEPHRAVPEELAVITAEDTPALWEVNIAHKWKLLTLELAAWLEDRWKAQQKRCQLRDCVHVDLERMQLLKPFFGELRRTQQPAVWLQWRRSVTRHMWRAKLTSLHVDSANAGRLLAPLGPTRVRPPPLGAPFIDVTCLTRHDLHSGQLVAIQALTIHMSCVVITLDRGVVAQLQSIFMPSIASFLSSSSADPSHALRADMALVHQSLSQLASQNDTSNTQQLLIIERLYCGPFTMQLVITPRTTPISHSLHDYISVLDYMFHSLDATDNSTKQNKFTFNSFELGNMSISLIQALHDMLELYRGELLQQFHVNVLGQEVLLNPLSQQQQTSNMIVETYIATAIEVERRCRGFLGLVHSTEPEPRRRPRSRPLPPAHGTFPASLSAASHSFQAGVPLAFSTPSSYKSQFSGVESFFRGSGKALAALMARGAVADCVAVAGDALRRAALLGERVTVRLRLPRYMQVCTALRPYSIHSAIGQRLLAVTAGGRYSNDTYWAHGALDATAKHLLLITLQHVFMVETCRQWGPWDVEWAVELDDVLSVPQLDDHGQQFVIDVRQDDTISANAGKYLICGDPDTIVWLRDKLEQALMLSMDDKCWTSLEH